MVSWNKPPGKIQPPHPPLLKCWVDLVCFQSPTANIPNPTLKKGKRDNIPEGIPLTYFPDSTPRKEIFACYSLQNSIVAIHSLRAGKNIIYRAVALFFLLRGLTNLKIDKYLISTSPLNCCICHCMKSVRIWSYSGPHFPALGLNTGRYSVYLSIQSKCRKREPE